jgi:hypothetical protein
MRHHRIRRARAGRGSLMRPYLAGFASSRDGVEGERRVATQRAAPELDSRVGVCSRGGCSRGPRFEGGGVQSRGLQSGTPASSTMEGGSRGSPAGPTSGGGDLDAMKTRTPSASRPLSCRPRAPPLLRARCRTGGSRRRRRRPPRAASAAREAGRGSYVDLKRYWAQCTQTSLDMR